MSLQQVIAPHITGIVARLQSAGFEAYVVGGAVRDFLLQRRPKDYDITTSATPEEVRKVFRDRRTMIIGRRFRLVHLFHKDEIIEISTFRRRPEGEGNPRKTARQEAAPERMIFQDNEYGSVEEDAWRRDFTVNALFYDPVENRTFDFTNMGKADLENRIVRAIGEPLLRFEEDPVRILRALKLAGQYGFSIEEKTREAILASLPLISHVPVSRLTLELEKILKNPYGDEILRVFHEYGFLSGFLPYLEKMWETEEGKKAMDMLKVRNERIRAGLYRDSISVGMSTLSYAFGKEKMDQNSWDDLIHKVLAPQTPTRRSVCAAVKTLSMQKDVNKVYNGAPIDKLLPCRYYAHGREIAIIRNAVEMTVEDVTKFLPEGKNERRKHPSRSGPPSFRRERRKGEGSAPPSAGKEKEEAFRKETPSVDAPAEKKKKPHWWEAFWKKKKGE